MDKIEYKPNSHTYKAKMAAEETKKKMEKAVSGPVTIKKKSAATKFANVFISEDIQDVKSFIVSDLLIPSAKKLLSDTIDRLLWGKGGRDSRRSVGEKISYRSFYDDRRDDRRSTRDDARPINRFDYDNIVIVDRGDAEAVLYRLEEALDRYKIVSVGDLYDLLGETAPYTAEHYGWISLRGARIKPVRGGYLLDLPPASPID